MGIKVIVAGMVAAGLGCAKASGGATATASLKMTGSSQPATVASYKKGNPLLQLLSPVAIALPPPAMMDSAGSTVQLTQSWIVVKEIEFKQEEAAGATEVEGAEIKFRGPYVVDLLSTIPASFGAAEVPAGIYRRIKMKLEKDAILPAGSPTELMGNSIFLQGTVAGKSFKYTSQDGTEFKISGPGGVNISDTANMVVGVKISDLIKKINLTAVVNNVAISEANRVAASTPCPTIDASAADLYTCFRKGLEQAGKFGKDSDDDGEIEVGEDEVKD